MALLTSDVILAESYDRYEANSVIMQLADGRFDAEWGRSSPKGDVVSIRLPVYASARRGDRADPKALDERIVQLRIPEAFGSDSLLTDRQLSMELEDFKSQVLDGHIDSISSAVAREACKTMAQGVSNFVGTIGAVPSTLVPYGDAVRLLKQGGTPTTPDSINFLVDAAMDQKAVEAGRLLQNPVAQITQQYAQNSMTGYQGTSVGGRWYLEQALYQHTIGALGGTPRLNGVVSGSSNTIVTDGWSNSVTGVLKKGDKVSFAGGGMVHPVLGTVYPNDLQNFSLAQDADSDGSGNATLVLTEAIETSGPYQNVAGVLADNALISVWNTAAAGQGAIAGTTITLGIAMHKSALVYASPMMVLPSNADKLSGVTRSKSLKISMRVWRDSDIRSGEVITRLDLLCGHLVGQPRRGVLIASV